MGGYTTNSKGERFIECDYWSGQMMMEFYREMEGAMTGILEGEHLADETISTIETILHTNERPSRGRFLGAWTITAKKWSKAYFGNGLCSGHSASRLSNSSVMPECCIRKVPTSVATPYSPGSDLLIPDFSERI